jgi:hypothetical protein
MRPFALWMTRRPPRDLAMSRARVTTDRLKKNFEITCKLYSMLRWRIDLAPLSVVSEPLIFITHRSRSRTQWTEAFTRRMLIQPVGASSTVLLVA